MDFDVFGVHRTQKPHQSVKQAECEHLIWFSSYLHDLIRVISGGCQEEFMSAHNSLRQEVLEQHAGVAVIAVLLCEQKSPSMPHTVYQPKHEHWAFWHTLWQKNCQRATITSDTVIIPTQGAKTRLTSDEIRKQLFILVTSDAKHTRRFVVRG